VTKVTENKKTRGCGGGGGDLSEAKIHPTVLEIPAFDRIVGLYNRHLNSNRGICLH
jgi:hypothetical protein